MTSITTANLQDMIGAARETLARNDRQHIAWDYGLHDAAEFEAVHADYRRGYSRARKAGYARFVAWLDRHAD